MIRRALSLAKNPVNRLAHQDPRGVFRTNGASWALICTTRERQPQRGRTRQWSHRLWTTVVGQGQWRFLLESSPAARNGTTGTPSLPASTALLGRANRPDADPAARGEGSGCDVRARCDLHPRPCRACRGAGVDGAGRVCSVSSQRDSERSLLHRSGVSHGRPPAKNLTRLWPFTAPRVFLSQPRELLRES